MRRSHPPASAHRRAAQRLVLCDTGGRCLPAGCLGGFSPAEVPRFPHLKLRSPLMIIAAGETIIVSLLADRRFDCGVARDPLPTPNNLRTVAIYVMLTLLPGCDVYHDGTSDLLHGAKCCSKVHLKIPTEQRFPGQVALCSGNLANPDSMKSKLHASAETRTAAQQQLQFRLYHSGSHSSVVHTYQQCLSLSTCSNDQLCVITNLLQRCTVCHYVSCCSSAFPAHHQWRWVAHDGRRFRPLIDYCHPWSLIDAVAC